MGKRENIIQWFDRLDSSERNSVLLRLSPQEKQQLQTLLGGSTAITLPPQHSEEQDANGVQKQLLGAPDLFLQLHNNADASVYPPKLADAVRHELDRMSKQTSTVTSGIPSVREDFLPLLRLLDNAKIVWLRFLKTFS